MNMFRLDGKVAVVTGGTGFYGKPICLALAEAGAQVIVASRSVGKCKEFSEELRKQNFHAEGMALDIEDEGSILELTRQIESRYGRLDVLVNNAVSREGFKNLEQLTKEDWEISQGVNSTGLVLLTRAAIELMMKQKSGNIINIGSIQGTVGPNFPVYGETGMTSPPKYTFDKWAMVGFTKWLANYYGRYNIRANCISPGGYGPGVEESVGDNEFVQNYKRLTPLGRFATDDDIKGPVVFLASEAAAYVTGHNLLVDGGWTNW